MVVFENSDTSCVLKEEIGKRLMYALSLTETFNNLEINSNDFAREVSRKLEYSRYFKSTTKVVSS